MSVRLLVDDGLPAGALTFPFSSQPNTQVYKAVKTASVNIIPLGTGATTFTFTVAGANFTAYTGVSVTMVTDGVTNYNGQNPFGLQSWEVGANDDDIIVRVFNNTGLTIPVTFNILYFA